MSESVVTLLYVFCLVLLINHVWLVCQINKLKKRVDEAEIELLKKGAYIEKSLGL